MADEIVEKIKNAVNIVDLIGDSVRLIKKGRNYSGLCPFHDEKTPSFSVSPERQSWHCFGCGKGGDIFSFVMEKEGLSFPEALDYLGRRAGIEIPRKKSISQSLDLYSVMERAVEFYQNELKGAAGSVGKGYLERRNMSLSEAAVLELGWSPSSWRVLGDALRKEGVTQEQLIKCGLVIEGEKGCYDRFRGRVIFPIRNVSGRAIGLGGRMVDGEGAKYLNSPEGPLYNKKMNLYLLNQAKGVIREKNRAILVEGYMDAIRLHMYGHREAVASLGTALTEEQAALLKRFSDQCYICYDSDTAGQDATLRGMYVLQRAGLSVFVVLLPEGKDPDELLQLPDGEALFDGALAAARPLVMHHIHLFKEAAQKGGEAKAAIELLTGMSQLSPVELAPYLQEIGKAVGLPDYQLTEELARLRRGRPVVLASEDGTPVFPEEEEEPAERQAPCDPGETALLYLLWSSRSLRLGASIPEVIRMLSDERLKDLGATILSGQSPQEIERRWLEMGEQFPLSVLAMGGNYSETLGGSDDDKWKRITSELKRREKQARYRQLKSLMLRGEAAAKDMAEYAALASELKK